MAGTTIRPIRTNDDFTAALARIDEIVGAAYGTPDADELQVLGTLVEAYESEHHPILPPDPIEAILVRLEDLGKSRKDLDAILGGRSRVSEILRRRRRLSLAMVRHLVAELRMPADVLVSSYPLAVRSTRDRLKGGGNKGRKEPRFT